MCGGARDPEINILRMHYAGTSVFAQRNLRKVIRTD